MNIVLNSIFTGFDYYRFQSNSVILESDIYILIILIEIGEFKFNHFD